MKDLKIEIEEPSKLLCDNKYAISITHDPVQHDHMKHVEIDSHFTKETLVTKRACTPYIESLKQRTKVLTKGLSIKQFMPVTSKLGMLDVHSDWRGRGFKSQRVFL